MRLNSLTHDRSELIRRLRKFSSSMLSSQEKQPADDVIRSKPGSAVLTASPHPRKCHLPRT